MLLRAILLTTLFSSSAFADAVIYRGTIGDQAVVVELSNPIHAPDPETFGRFFYIDKGIDIPLDAVGSRPGAINLVEERPCNLDLCRDPIDSAATPQPPLGPTWHLRGDNGARLTGEWQPLDGEAQAIDLTRIATRPFALDDNPGPMDLLVSPVDFNLDSAPLTFEGAPYDYLRMTSDTRKWGVNYIEDMAWRTVQDPRTGLSMPRLVANGGDIGPANRWLEQRHWMMNTEAYDCAAAQYMAFGWSEQDDGIAGTFAGYDSELVEVTMMIPDILSWTEEGSTGCGNHAPWNHWRILNLDLETGRPFDLSLVFKSWIPDPFGDGSVTLEMARANPGLYPWGPDKALADFVRAHRLPMPFPSYQDECDYDALIESNLAIGFRQNGDVYFALDNLPNVIQACAYELYTSSIEELRPFLANTAGDYFWEVDHPSR